MLFLVVDKVPLFRQYGLEARFEGQGLPQRNDGAVFGVIQISLVFVSIEELPAAVLRIAELFIALGAAAIRSGLFQSD